MLPAAPAPHAADVSNTVPLAASHSSERLHALVTLLKHEQTRQAPPARLPHAPLAARNARPAETVRAPVLACTCLPDGRVALLEPDRILLWECHTSDPCTPCWRPALALTVPRGSQLHTLAVADKAMAASTPPSSQPEPIYVAACGTIAGSVGVVGGAPARRPSLGGLGGGRGGGRGGAASSSKAATYEGAAVFRLDALSSMHGWGAPANAGAAAAAGPCPAAAAAALPTLAPRALLQSPGPSTSAALLLEPPGPLLPGEAPSTTLALGGADSRVHLWRLSHPASEEWRPLQTPAERPDDEYDAGIRDYGAVLTLRPLSAEFGLLLGGYASGAALWQTSAINGYNCGGLINFFVRQEPLLPIPSYVISAPLVLAERLRLRPGPVNEGRVHGDVRDESAGEEILIGDGSAAAAAATATAAAASQVACVAALIVALPPRPLKPYRDEIENIPRRYQLPCPANEVGYVQWGGHLSSGSVIVATALGWLHETDQHAATAGTAAHVELPRGTAATRAPPPLARRFVLTSTASIPVDAYYTGGDGVLGGAAAGWTGDTTLRAPVEDESAPLVCLATDGAVMAAVSVSGCVHVWSARLAHHLVTLRPPPPPSLASPLKSTPPPFVAVLPAVSILMATSQCAGSSRRQSIGAIHSAATTTAAGALNGGGCTLVVFLGAESAPLCWTLGWPVNGALVPGPSEDSAEAAVIDALAAEDAAAMRAAQDVAAMNISSGGAPVNISGGGAQGNALDPGDVPRLMERCADAGAAQGDEVPARRVGQEQFALQWDGGGRSQSLGGFSELENLIQAVSASHQMVA